MFSKPYVYKHLHICGQCIYVGRGVGGRAWDIKSRKKAHKELLESFTHDYVELVETLLTDHEALLLERHLIRELDPMYNIQERIKTKPAKFISFKEWKG